MDASREPRGARRLQAYGPGAATAATGRRAAPLPSCAENLMRRLIVTILLLLPAASSLAARPDDELRRSAESIVSALQESWNARDAQRWSESFAEKHDYVAIGGMLLAELTPQQNATGHTALWNGRFREGSRIALALVSVASLAPNVAVALVRNRNDYVDRGQAKNHTSVISLVLVKEAAGWRIRQFNNNLQASP